MPNNDSKRVAVYIPYATLLTALDALGVALPPRLDTSVWSNFSGGVRTHVWSAFKFLGLIKHDGVPQASLEKLVDKEADRNEVLRQVIETAYADVVGLAKQNASKKQLEDGMREYGIQGEETIAKAVRFYMQAADQLGLPVSNFWGKAKAIRSPGSRRKKAKTKTPPPPATDPEPLTPQSDSEDLHTLELSGIVKVTLNVTGPLTKLPREDRVFVFSLVDSMDDYEAKQRQPKATVDGRKVPAVMETPKLAPEAAN